MTSSILDAAKLLMSVHNFTTTLDVKNFVHSQNSHTPGFRLTQAEVSREMKALAKSEGWIAKQSANGPYMEYSFDPAQVMMALPGRVNPTDPMVAYIRTNKSFYVSGPDKNTVRRNLYALANYAFSLGISHDDINYCTQDYYNKHHK